MACRWRLPVRWPWCRPRLTTTGRTGRRQAPAGPSETSRLWLTRSGLSTTARGALTAALGSLLNWPARDAASTTSESSALMRLNDIVGESGRPPRTTVPASAPVPVPDLVGRHFAPSQPDLAWAGDITYVPTAEGGCTWPA